MLMVEPEVKDDDVAGSLHLSLSMTILLRGWSVVTCCAAAPSRGMQCSQLKIQDNFECYSFRVARAKMINYFS